MRSSLQQLMVVLLSCISSAVALQCHPHNSGKISLKECVSATEQLWAPFHPILLRSQQSFSRTFTRNDPDPLKSMPKFAVHGHCLISLIVQSYTATAETNMETLFDGLRQLLTVCVHMHHVGGNLVVDGIDIEVEHRRRALGHIAATDRPAVRRTSQHASEVSLVVASRHVPNVLLVRASPRALGHIAATDKPAVRRTSQHASKVSLVVASQHVPNVLLVRASQRAPAASPGGSAPS